MFESALLIRWSISVVVIILLLIALYFGLRILKAKGYQPNIEHVLKHKNKMQIIETLHIDSKNKLVKVQDQDQILTLLIGNGSLIEKQKIKIQEK